MASTKYAKHFFTLRMSAQNLNTAACALREIAPAVDDLSPEVSADLQDLCFLEAGLDEKHF